jgi:hypothetical protein
MAIGNLVIPPRSLVRDAVRILIANIRSRLYGVRCGERIGAPTGCAAKKFTQASICEAGFSEEA